jgi:RNA polymerase sigma-70 factor (ECF subfamily)
VEVGELLPAMDRIPDNANDPLPSADQVINQPEEGLAAKWEKSRAAVFALLLARIGSIHDAEDVLQEVAVSIARDYDRYDPERPFVAWALGIARNQALMFLRKQSRDRLCFGEDMMRVVESHLEETPSKALDNQREALHQCMASLSPDLRQLLRMRYSGDHDLEFISGQLGKSIAGIKGQLYRVRRILADCIKRRLASS